ncbi:XRE family transcriptional regulator [Streptomyces sp. NPDC004111]|uniref:XRE family transcriptional regulator n=1 Tax=Streptomyces sp. NPDC004111 TaxID=3364690 RepID=UPI00367E01C3
MSEGKPKGEIEQRRREPATFQERLNLLFEVIHPPDRGPYSEREISALMTAKGLESVSHVYLLKLRSGKSDNPSKRVLENLAKVFDVTPAYWFDDEEAEKTKQALELLHLMQQEGIQNLMLRLSGVSSDNTDVVRDLLDSLRRKQGLPPVK